MATDIQLSYNGAEDLDIYVQNGDFVSGDALATAILVSVFTWAPARNDDVVPDGMGRGGYWGDGVESAPLGNPRPIGSRLWLLDGKTTDENVRLVAEYIRESLDWMNSDNRIQSFEVSADRPEPNRINAMVSVVLANSATRRFNIADITNRK